MVPAIIIIIAIAAVLVFFYLRKKTPAKKSSQPVKQIDLYRSVTVCTDEFACSSARALIGKRFLISETPLLPLLNCSSEKCGCKYEHYSDRRDVDDDRRLPISLKSNLFTAEGAAERRRKLGRRTGDWRSKDL